MHWVTGTPLWRDATTQVAAGDQFAMRRPALLRFASDDFMNDLTGVLRTAPAALGGYRATAVSYRPRPPGAPDSWRPATSSLKLYQPFHGQFNLVVASLVCRLAGLPDHGVRTAEAERVGFVLRRLAPDGAPVGTGQAAPAELTWSVDADGARRWVALPPGAPAALAPGEDVLPMFPVVYDDAGRPRRVWAGLIPTSSRETYRAAPSAAVPPFPERPGGGKPDDDPRWNQFDVRVIGPLADLQGRDLQDRPVRPMPADLRPEASAFVLLDFADLLSQYLPQLWAVLRDPAPAPGAVSALDQPAQRLHQALLGDKGVDWAGRLAAAAAHWAVITGEEPGSVDLHCDLAAAAIHPATLQGLIRAALPGRVPGPDVPAGLDLPKIEPLGDARYVIRCVYLRPRCPQAQPVSEPSEQFSIASVFDPDAPARPIRIPMPIETGMKDLRKFPKNVGFMVSNQLRGQLNRVTDLQKALNGTVDDEEHWDLGVICQFSLPIITIVALMLLIVIVFLLNIVFFWVPIFRICVPVPLRSKS
jgi:hypothetical protein